MVMERRGFPRQLVAPCFERRDLSNVDQWGFTIERFQASMIDTYRAFVAQANRQGDPRTEARLKTIAQSVARTRARNLNRATEVLETLHAAFRLVLLTKGVASIQEQRIDDSGLRRLFETIYIVERKDEVVFRKVISDLKVRPDAVWSIGDSLRSDILPAIKVGAHGVWIPQRTWEFEEDVLPEATSVQRIRSLQYLPALLLRAKVMS
jgi:putative hydrolase of the HAD superfamily